MPLPRARDTANPFQVRYRKLAALGIVMAGLVCWGDCKTEFYSRRAQATVLATRPRNSEVGIRN